MNRLFKMAVRNARRNSRRTMLTAGTVMIGTALVTVGMAFMNGMFNTMLSDLSRLDGHIRLVDPVFAEREQLNPLYANLPEVDGLLTKVRAVPGVEAAEALIRTGVVVTTTDEIGDDFGMVVGATPGWFTDRLQGPNKLIRGTWLTGAKDEVVLGQKLASDVDAVVGGEILLLGQTQYGSMSPINAKVVGIVSAGPMADRQAFIRLEDAQWMIDLEGGAIEVVAYTSDFNIDTVQPVLDAVHADPDLTAYSATGWFERGMIAKQLPLVGAIQSILSMMMAFVTMLAIFNTMTMAVLERTPEVGVLRAMGMRRRGVLGMFLIEAGLIGLIGGLVGGIVGAIGGLYLESNGVSFGAEVVERMADSIPLRETLYADMTPDLFFSALVLGTVTAIVGALIPAITAARIQPVTAMRSRR